MSHPHFRQYSARQPSNSAGSDLSDALHGHTKSMYDQTSTDFWIGTGSWSTYAYIIKTPSRVLAANSWDYIYAWFIRPVLTYSLSCLYAVKETRKLKCAMALILQIRSNQCCGKTRGKEQPANYQWCNAPHSYTIIEPSLSRIPFMTFVHWCCAHFLCVSLRFQ